MRLTAIVPLAAALALAACGGSETSGEITTDDGDTGEYTIDNETGESSMTITTPDGETRMQSGPGVAPDLPSGWTIYPGAEVVNTVNIAGAEGGGALVTMTTDASADDVIAHYRKQAEAAGFPISLEMNTSASRLISGQKDNGASFSVSVALSEDDSPTMVQLTLADGD